MKKSLLIFSCGISLISSACAMKDIVKGVSDISVSEKPKWNPKLYELNSGPQFENAKEVLSQYDLKGKKIVDVGCGGGRTTKYMAELVGNVVEDEEFIAVDTDINMIKYAEEKYSDRGKEGYLKNVTFFNITEDFKVKFENEDFEEEDDDDPMMLYDLVNEDCDFVTAWASAHWMKDLKTFLKVVFKCLKKGGIFLATIGLDRDVMERPIVQAMQKTLFSYKWDAFFAPLKQQLLRMPGSLSEKIGALIKQDFSIQNKETLRPILEEVGFSDIDLNESIKTIEFENKEKLVLWLEGWLGGMKTIAQIFKDKPAEYKNFIEDSVDECLRMSDIDVNTTGPVPFQTQVLFVEAAK